MVCKVVSEWSERGFVVKLGLKQAALTRSERRATVFKSGSLVPRQIGMSQHTSNVFAFHRVESQEERRSGILGISNLYDSILFNPLIPS